MVECYKRGEGTYNDVADAHEVGRASVSRWLRLDRENGSPAHRPWGIKPRAVNDKGVSLIRSLLEKTPDITMEKLTERYNRRKKKNKVSASTIGRIVRNRLGLTRKKRRSELNNRIPNGSRNFESDT